MSILTGRFYTVISPFKTSGLIEYSTFKLHPEDQKFPMCFRREIRMEDNSEVLIQYIRFATPNTAVEYTISNETGTIAEIMTPDLGYNPNLKDMLFSFLPISEQDFWSNLR